MGFSHIGGQGIALLIFVAVIIITIVAFARSMKK